MRQIQSKKISKFFIMPGFPGMMVTSLRPYWPHDADFSIIEAGSPFDQGPFISLDRQ